jgi:hypothetical protein
MMHGFDVYRTYLAMKLHFGSDKFDFFQYDGKVNAKESTYHDRKDFYFFETVARKFTEQEIKEYMLASFVEAENPSKVWIGDIKRSGKDNWLVWAGRQQSLSYAVSEDLDRVVDYLSENGHGFNTLFESHGGHPPLLKLHIKGKIILETLVILDMILGFIPQWNDTLRDPLWEQLSFKIKKYKPFLSIPTDKYRSMMQEKFCA